MKALLLNRLLILLGFAGLFVAGVLSLAHRLGLQVPCGMDNPCDQLAAHPASKWLGIPVAYYGLAAYAFLTAVAIFRELVGLKRSQALFNFGFFVALLGAVVSGLLQYQAIMSLGVRCSWCIASAIVMGVTLLVYIFLANLNQEIEARPNTFVIAGCAIAAIGATGFVFKEMSGNPSEVTRLDPERAQKIEADLLGNEARVIGNPNAPITIIEFADALCAMCRQTYPEVKKLMEESGGKIRLAFRHYPLYRKPEHAMALPVAMVAEYAADKGKFWKFLDLAFAGNSESVQTLDGIYDLAREAGLNYNEVKNLIEGQDEKLLDRVEADIHKANELGIKSTPTYIILAQGLPTRRAVGTQIRTLLSLPEYKRILASDEQKS